MNKIHVISIAALVMLPLPALSGPFGINVDDFSLSKYGCEQIKGSYYRCSNTPKKHPDIERYVVKYVSSVGVCMIKGISIDIRDNSFGSNVHSAVDKIAGELSEKYGHGEKIDRLEYGSIWDEPQDWMMGVVKGERTYAYNWDLKSPIDGINGVWTSAEAISSDKSYWIVEFYTPLSDKCDEADKKSNADAF